MAVPEGIAFRDLERNHYYRLSQNPQTISTGQGLSADVINNLWQLKDTPHQLIQINCSNNNCAASFRRPQEDAFGSTSFIIRTIYLQDGDLTRFTEITTLPPGAGASGGAKRNRRKSKKTRKSKKKSRKQRKVCH